LGSHGIKTPIWFALSEDHRVEAALGPASVPERNNLRGYAKHHPRINAGFFGFSQLRLVPLEYRLPERFDTIPSRPSLQALANTSAPSADRASLNRMLSTPWTMGS
jgi:hypothetical protein